MSSPASAHRLQTETSKSGSLRSRLLLTIVLPITGLLVIVVAIFIFSATRLTRTLVQERDAQLVKLAARQVAGYWYDSVLLLSQIAANEAIRSGDPQASLEILSANLTLSQRFDQVAITDPQGTIIVATGNVAESLVLNQPWIERSGRLRRPVLSSVFQDSLERQKLCVSIPIYDNAGNSSGYAIGIWDLDGDRLGRPIANISIGQAGSVYLIDNDGTILYHPDSSRIGVRDLQDPAYVTFKKQPGAQTLNIENTLRVVGFAPIPFQELGTSLFADESWGNWNLVINESLGDILAPLQPYVPLMLILAGIVILVPAFIVWISSKNIAVPLQSLAAQAERVASGDFSEPLKIAAGPQEVRELEEAFNSMVEQLRRYRADIQNYVGSILNSQEQERKRIARELHDDTAQALIVLGRRIESLQDITNPEELSAELENVRDMVDDTLQGVRSFTSDLRPPLLTELGLPRTLQLLGDRTEREEPFTVSVEIIGQIYKLSDALELGLYRLAQESLSNVRRHAQARHVRVVLRYEPNLVTLEIIDDGIGFEVSTNMNDLAKAGRLGLIGIIERARLFGGRAQIISKPGGGTTVRIVIPVDSQQNGD